MKQPELGVSGGQHSRGLHQHHQLLAEHGAHTRGNGARVRHTRARRASRHSHASQAMAARDAPREHAREGTACAWARADTAAPLRRWRHATRREHAARTRGNGARVRHTRARRASRHSRASQATAARDAPRARTRGNGARGRHTRTGRASARGHARTRGASGARARGSSFSTAAVRRTTSKFLRLTRVRNPVDGGRWVGRLRPNLPRETDRHRLY